MRASPCEPGLCHNDLNRRNILDLGSSLCFVDWELAGMNDPAFDVAAVSLTAGLDAAQESFFVEALAGAEAPSLSSRLALAKTTHAIREALWFLVLMGAGDDYFARLKSFDARFDFRAHFERLARENLSRLGSDFA